MREQPAFTRPVIHNLFVRSGQCGRTDTCFWNYRDLLIGNASGWS